ncbi:hypothetical protein CCMSSC00406_0008573 [Pleurotus cornucopiae]|uniref:Uncharacterized protein n=1 Tax=Pleurotus cornucopiae TaxID=5321 RepID=A0ACB7II52_PLECO|nr:hypothetical protein CCMSSC00406_0008573 [Pleurotus cornucopiae]
MHSPPHPPQSPTDKALEDALEAANLVLGAIDMLLQYQASAKGVMMQPFVVPDYFLGSLLRLKLVAQTFKDTPNAPALNIAAYFSPLPETPEIDANSELGFCSLIRKVYSNLPPPSDYATTWPEHQPKNPTLLCARPASHCGLPLSMLHHTFREFGNLIDSVLPNDCHTADLAFQVATRLCSQMSDPYEDKGARSNAFDEIVKPLFDHWGSQHRIAPNAEVTSARVDRVLTQGGRIVILREDKNEGGAGGDVYMQLSRDFDMFRKTEGGVEGAPVFLVGVWGAALFVAGAFHDGVNAVIEPLTDLHFMYADKSRRRPLRLARVLYALSVVLNKIDDASLVHQPIEPSIPRVYTDCVDIHTGSPVGLLSRFEPSSFPERLIFSALLTRDQASPIAQPERVFVKLVDRRPYGAQVHSYLATKGYAPHLHGYKILQGAPTAYVMEYLGHPWVSLFDLSQREDFSAKIPSSAMDRIKGAVCTVLQALESGQLVHGDLRPNNIMVKLDVDGRLEDVDGVRLKIVDFDWAGQVGTVKYPLSRNEGISWPGPRGAHIQQSDDKRLFESWWPEFCTYSRQPQNSV